LKGTIGGSRLHDSTHSRTLLWGLRLLQEIYPRMFYVRHFPEVLPPDPEERGVSGRFRMIAMRPQATAYPWNDDSGWLQRVCDKKALSNLQTSALPLGYRALAKPASQRGDITVRSKWADKQFRWPPRPAKAL